MTEPQVSPVAAPNEVAGPPRHRPGSSAAAETVWDWRRIRAAREAQRQARRARRQGLIQGAVGAAVATWVLLAWSPAAALLIYGLTAFFAASALASPSRLYPRLRVPFDLLGRGVALVLSWILLVPFFYLVLVPLGCVRKLRAPDPLLLRIDKSASSYWLDREAAPARESYDRQF